MNNTLFFAVIRMANEMMKNLVTKQTSNSSQMKDASVDTSNLDASPPLFDESVVRKEELDGNDDFLTPGGGPVRPYQRLVCKLY